VTVVTGKGEIKLEGSSRSASHGVPYLKEGTGTPKRDPLKKRSNRIISEVGKRLEKKKKINVFKEVTFSERVGDVCAVGKAFDLSCTAGLGGVGKGEKKKVERGGLVWKLAS